MIEIVSAATSDQMESVRTLFREHADGLGSSFHGQGFEQELAALPGDYAPPRGRLLLAQEVRTGAVVGCVALRALDAESCEMRRLYLRPTARGQGVGRALAEAVIAEAQAIGYRRMRLDTLASARAAVQLYRALGFVEIAPYYDNPIPGVIYLELDLTRLA